MFQSLRPTAMLDATTTVPALELRGLGKRFPGVVALDDVSLAINAGEVHGLIGQNGAGKSTLINIISGMYPADAGSVEIAGRPYLNAGPRHALASGVATVYQELSLLPNLTIAENLVLGREPRRWGLLDRQEARHRTRAALDTLGLELDPDTAVSNLTLAEKQLVEIAKALAAEPRVLVLDEPTAPLGVRESQLLFDAIARLRERGVAILYVSHRFAEVLALCGRVTVLRNGRHIVTTSIQGWTEARLTEAMIGTAAELYQRSVRPRGEVALALRDITWGQRLRGAGFELHRGEIAALTGLLGAGQNELGRIVGGDLMPNTGDVIVGDHIRHFSAPSDAIKAGVCMLTEERKHEGIFPNLTLRENIGVGSLRALSGPLGLVGGVGERGKTAAAARAFGVVAASLDVPIRTLSGGNQQKALVARWHLADMDVFVLIEPTRGVDVGARADIYRRLDELARAGKAILIVSSDITEVLTLADRILVVCDGRISSEAKAGDLDEEALNLMIQGAAAA